MPMIPMTMRIMGCRSSVFMWFLLRCLIFSGRYSPRQTIISYPAKMGNLLMKS